MGMGVTTFGFLRRVWSTLIELDTPKSWNHVRGPIGAVKLSLARIGWRATESFLSFEGPDEMTHTFLDIGPRMVGAMWKQDWHTMLGNRRPASWVCQNESDWTCTTSRPFCEAKVGRESPRAQRAARQWTTEWVACV